MRNITLESVEKLFQQWRAGRRNQKEAIPERLWIMALSLYPEYKTSKICQSLRLSGSDFKRRLGEKSLSTPDKGFVLASSSQSDSAPEVVNEVELTLQGKERKLTLSIDVRALNQVLPHFEALL